MAPSDTSDAVPFYDLEEELSTAREIVRTTWERIAHYYDAPGEIFHKEEGPATAADREASEMILHALHRKWPEDGLLSEEEVESEVPHRLERDRVWIVDPIDGTRDFIERRGNFALQIGLVTREDGVWRPRLGVVYHPVGDCLYYARAGGGAWVESHDGSRRPVRVSEVDVIEGMAVVATRSHRTPLFLELLDLLEPREILTMGSLGLKAVRVAEGRADYYLNNCRGRCREWDLCAPEAIVLEAGGVVTDLDTGGVFKYNLHEARPQGGILVSNGRRHEELRRRILEMEHTVRARAKARSEQ